MDGEDSDEKIEKFFAEDDLRAKINRTFLGLEVMKVRESALPRTKVRGLKKGAFFSPHFVT